MYRFAIVVVPFVAIGFVGCRNATDGPEVGETSSAGQASNLFSAATSKPLTNPFVKARAAEHIDSIAHLQPNETLLAIERQKEVWDAEHITHMIEWRLGKRFRATLFGDTPQSIEEFFVADAAGVTFDTASAKKRTLAGVEEHYGDRTFLSASDADRAKIVSWLTGIVKQFSVVDSSSFRVLYIDRVESDGKTNNVWGVRILLSCRGTNQEGARQELKSEHSLLLSWQDEDELNGSPVIQRWVAENFALRRGKSNLMQEVTEEAGLSGFGFPDNWEDGASSMLSMQVAVDDIDRDGFLDIVVATSTGQQYFLRSLKGKRFAKAAEFTRRTKDKYGVDFSAGIIDIDRDGFPDLLVGRRMYKNARGRGLRDVTESTGLKFAESQSMGYSIIDFDLDGHLDIYCNYSLDFRTRETRRGWIGDEDSGALNQLWRNRGDGTFEEVALTAKADGGKRQTFASVWLHANDDALPDLYLANDFSPNVFLLNRGDGTFEDISSKSGTADFATTMGAAAGDFNNDGTSELYIANMYSKMGRRIVGQVGPNDYPTGVFSRIVGACHGNRFYQRNAGEQEYRELSMQLGINDIGWAYAPVTFDCDNDGNLDLYATTGFLSFDRTKPDG